MKYRFETATLGGRRVRITHVRRHWFFRWQLHGVEVWTGPAADGGYAYVVFR